MICTPCRKAGEFNTLANQAQQDQRNSSRDLLRENARQSHSECPGGTWCDCQHVPGHALNELAVAQLRNKPKPDLGQSPVAVDDAASAD